MDELVEKAKGLRVFVVGEGFDHTQFGGGGQIFGRAIALRMLVGAPRFLYY